VFLRKGNTKGYEEMLKDINYKVGREGNGILTPLFYAGTKLFARDRGIESTVDLDLIMKVPEIAKREGTELEFVIMVIAVSCVKLLSAHNSTQHTSRKHKV
jgi:hypothetical protein